MKKFLMVIVAFTAFVSEYGFLKADATSEKLPFIVRVNIRPPMPVDPLNIVTMAEYDLSLCLYRTWFEYDSARMVKPGIVSSWEFNEKYGTYTFKISKEAKWSNGAPIEASQLLSNLDRAIKSGSNYGASISAIISIKSAKIISTDTFELMTVDKKPSTSFFQRMGGVMLSPVHPESWDKKWKVINNKIVSGPFAISDVSQNQIRLTKNIYDRLAFETRPDEVLIRPNQSTDIAEFLEGKSWANVVQTNTLLPVEMARKVKENQMPHWTRGYDRVSLLRPNSSSKKLAQNREIVRVLMALWPKHNVLELPLNSIKALSLQPQGYPLFHAQPISDASPLISQLEILKSRTIKILGVKSPSLDFQKTVLKNFASKYGLGIQWEESERFQDLVSRAKSDPSIDLELISFGVADPEPAIWLGLVINQDTQFIDVESKDLSDYQKILSVKSKVEEIRQFQDLLIRIGKRGSYMPLFHFSTLSLGQPGINFGNILPLDETVDYSKLTRN